MVVSKPERGGSLCYLVLPRDLGERSRRVLSVKDGKILINRNRLRQDQKYPTGQIDTSVDEKSERERIFSQSDRA